MTIEDRFYKNMPMEYKRFLRGMVPDMGEEEFERFYKTVSNLKPRRVIPPIKYLKHFEKYFNDKDLFYEFMKHSYNQYEHKAEEAELEWEEYQARRFGVSRQRYREILKKMALEESRLIK